MCFCRFKLLEPRPFNRWQLQVPKKTLKPSTDSRQSAIDQRSKPHSKTKIDEPKIVDL